jgi:hypothetical protein
MQYIIGISPLKWRKFWSAYLRSVLLSPYISLILPRRVSFIKIHVSMNIYFVPDVLCECVFAKGCRVKAITGYLSNRIRWIRQRTSLNNSGAPPTVELRSLKQNGGTLLKSYFLLTHRRLVYNNRLLVFRLTGYFQRSAIFHLRDKDTTLCRETGKYI